MNSVAGALDALALLTVALGNPADPGRRKGRPTVIGRAPAGQRPGLSLTSQVPQ